MPNQKIRDSCGSLFGSLQEPRQSRHGAANDDMEATITRIPVRVQRAMRSACSPLRGALVAGLIGVVPLANAASFPPIFAIGSLYPAGGGDGSAGFVLTRIGANDGTGGSVGGAGDVNGNGTDDLIVGGCRSGWTLPRGRELHRLRFDARLPGSAAAQPVAARLVTDVLPAYKNFIASGGGSAAATPNHNHDESLPRGCRMPARDPGQAHDQRV